VFCNHPVLLGFRFRRTLYSGGGAENGTSVNPTSRTNSQSAQRVGPGCRYLTLTYLRKLCAATSAA
jgi:hypothetical protein